MASVFLLNYYESFDVNSGASHPKLVGVFSTYSLAWDALETHAKQFPGMTLDLSNADMGAIMLDDGQTGDIVAGGYSLEEETLDMVLS